MRCSVVARFRPRPSPRRIGAVVVVVTVLLGVLSGCRLDVVAEVAVEADGSGAVTLRLHADEVATDHLRSLEVDPTVPLAEAASRAPAWEVEPEVHDGRLVVELRHEADDPQALADALRDLSSTLADDDPALLVDLDLDVGPEGEVRLRGEAGVRPPATAGAIVDGRPVGPSGGELAVMTAQVVHPRLRITLPGRVVSHDADGVDGDALLWDLPVGETRDLAAVARPPEGVRAAPVVITGVVLTLVLLAVLWRRRRTAPGGREP